MRPSTANIKARLSAAQRAVNGLAANGFDVLDVQLGNSQPVIEISRPTRDLFKGQVAAVSSRSGGQLHHRMVSRYLGCLVQWEEERQ
ncbi:hypothetical protein PVT67_11795 [Gallaecimonas kandeliae]|uniref:hypothetical protein n=1 Tax=Gallaecimonas kandeliae TaxID=3029055 RepID=UPI0026483E78|nr:hypothetical protein [Gallaecimonas kandeliae]WKE64361.1 hypothetical protein PVT67_11795 [Gallaecimonas kandeliae]